MANTALDLEAIEARCEALDERMSDMSELAWTLEGPNHYGLFSVYDSDGNTVSHGIRERQDFIAHTRRDVPALLAAIKRLYHELHDERVRRDEWEKMNNRLIAGTEVEWLYERVRQVNTSLGHEVDSRVRAELGAELMQAELMHARAEVERLQAELAQARVELMQLRKFWLNPAGAAEYRRQLTAMTANREFWYEEAQDAKSERDKIRQDAQEQSDEVQELWLSPCEAEGLRRQLAQAVVAQADAELAAHIHDKSCGELAQTVRTERALRREMEAFADDYLRKLRIEQQLRIEMGQRAERAESLATLANEGTAALLKRLAGRILARPHSYANPLSGHACLWRKDTDAASELAARIREALEEAE